MNELPPTAFDRQKFAVLFLALLVVAAGNTALQSVLPAIGREIGIKDVYISMIFSISAAFWTVSAPFWAHQAYRHGRKNLVRLGLAGYIVSVSACGVIIYAGLHHLITPIKTVVGFAIMRGLFGLFGSATNPAAQAYVATETAQVNRTAALASLSSAFGLGTVLGPALAAMLILPVLGLSTPLFLFALLAAITLAAVSRVLPQDTPQKLTQTIKLTRQRLSWRDPRISPFLLCGIIIGNAQAATGQLMGFLIIDMLHLKPEAAQSFIGVAMMAGAASTLLAQWGLIRTFRMTPRQLLQWGVALAALGALMTGFAQNYVGVVSGFAVMSLGFGFARPGFTAGASLAVSVGEQDSVAGAVTAINGCSFIFAPAIGIILYHISRYLPFVGAAALLLGICMYASYNTQIRRVSVLGLSDEVSGID